MKIEGAQNFIEKQDIDLVEEFSIQTGDVQTLSRVDKLVIAAGLTVARQKKEFQNVRKEPAKLDEFRPRAFKDFYADDEDLDAFFNEDNNEQKQEEDLNETAEKSEIKNEDEFQEIKQDKSSRKNRGKAAEVGTIKDSTLQQNRGFSKEMELKLQQKLEKQKKLLADDSDEQNEPVQTKLESLQEPLEEVKEQDSDSIDNEEDGGEWVTNENIHKHLSNNLPQNPTTNKDKELFSPQVNKKDQANIKYIKFITSDFAMQNVIIQMGFQLLNLDGMRLTRVKRFKLLCKGCRTMNMDVERLFCKSCGGAFLTKVSVYLNDHGEMTYFNNPKRKINLKGTVYSIPNPKGGRGCQDLILREDDLNKGEYKQMQQRIEKIKRQEMKSINDTLDGNYWAGGEGYNTGASVSNLLYENGAKGGKIASKRNLDKIVVGFGKKNPNIARKKV